MKTLLMVAAEGRPERNELLRMEAADEHPRALLFEDRLRSDILDGNCLRALPVARRLVHRPLARYFAQVLTAWAKQGRYDAVISWGEPLSLLYGMLLKLTASRTRHVALMYWISPPPKALLLKAVQSHIDQIIMWSPLQRDIAVERLGIPASKVTLIPSRVDQRFWRPMTQETDMICAAGNEMRDYPTLIDAMRGLEIRCHIAARDRGSAFRPVVSSAKSRRRTTARAVIQRGGVPENVTVGPLTYRELRMLYARSRFVVVPLAQTDTDNGSTTILEAMAMGKAVICSRADGQVGIIEEGKTGLFVPPGDPEALRAAIQNLWDHPDEAARMGAVARRRVEERYTFDQFVERVYGLVEAVTPQTEITPRAAARSG